VKTSSEANNQGLEAWRVSLNIHKTTIPQLHEYANPQKDNSTIYQMHKTPREQKHKLLRLHIQIRQDIVDKLLDKVQDGTHPQHEMRNLLKWI